MHCSRLGSEACSHYGASGRSRHRAAELVIMPAWLGDNVEAWAWHIAVVGFLCCALWETFAPARQQNEAPIARWVNHFALYGVSIILVTLLVPSERAASWLGGTGYGPLALVHAYAGDGVIVAVGILALDFYIYVLHRLEHAVQVLWRLHVVHHSDIAVDASTSLRHHPLESLVNNGTGNLLFALLGLPLWAFACYGALSGLVGLLQHANVRLPPSLESLLNLVIVGPSLHRAHHSSDPMFHNNNFGIVFTFWDRLFGTYRRPGTMEQDRLAFGVREVSNSGRTGAAWAWILPLVLRSQPKS